MKDNLGMRQYEVYNFKSDSCMQVILVGHLTILNQIHAYKLIFGVNEFPLGEI